MTTLKGVRPAAGGRGGTILCALGVFSLFACGPRTEPPPSAGPAAVPSVPPDQVFVDDASAAGLDFVHFNGATGEDFMVEVLGAGGALFDYDNDGDLDVYLVQGALLGAGKSLDQALFPPRSPLTDRLFRSDLEVTPDGERRLHFTDVTAAAGFSAAGYGMGVAAGDYDNDGYVDLYLTNFGHNQLLHNNGDGTFRDVTAAAGVDDPRWSVPAVFFDYDRDGWLDLYVGNYVSYDLERPPLCKDLTGARDYCGPSALPPQSDRLFHNRGDGTFEDVTRKAGLVAGFGPALGAIAADFDGDGWLDLYVANDGTANNLWMNRHDGTFEDEGLLSGAAVNADGKAQGSMGVDAADVDGDGDLDLFMTHLTRETNTFYLNDGGGMFEDKTGEVGLGSPSMAFTSFGTAWFDYDNDGWLDLLVVNGAVTKIPELVRAHDPYPLHQPNQLFRNLGVAGLPRFEEVTPRGGPVLGLPEVSRAAVFGDVDNDGDTDVLLTSNNGPVHLLLNQVGARHHWLGLHLVTGTPPRDVPGARAAVLRAGKPPLWRRVRVDGSYCAANDPRLLFGLGDAAAVSGVRVLWPDGRSEEWTDVATDRYTTLAEGSGRAVSGASR